MLHRQILFLCSQLPTGTHNAAAGSYSLYLKRYHARANWVVSQNTSYSHPLICLPGSASDLLILFSDGWFEDLPGTPMKTHLRFFGIASFWRNAGSRDSGEPQKRSYQKLPMKVPKVILHGFYLLEERLERIAMLRTNVVVLAQNRKQEIRAALDGRSVNEQEVTCDLSEKQPVVLFEEPALPMNDSSEKRVAWKEEVWATLVLVQS